MQTRAVHLKQLGWIKIEPLRNGDTQTVAALFDRLGPESRVRRFNAAKPRLTSAELATLATVDSRRHALVAYVAGDPEPAGFAQLVRDADEWTSAEIAFAVADAYHRRGIGSTLVDLLAADARAGGITHLTATIQSSNTAAFVLVKRVAKPLDLRFEGGETALVAALSAA
ncbi:MAG: GNAT family N-acetyltransferase [Gaiellaceae bacterium]